MNHNDCRAVLGALGIVLLSGSFGGLRADEPAPRNVTELWADFDPRSEPLDVEIVRQWERNEIVYRYVTFHVATFKGEPARMAGFYAFPQTGSRLPGLLHLHGGGQRAFLHEVEFYAAQGYACLSINWGGREMEEAQPQDPNTDWGAVDPTQQNVPGYFNLMPNERTIDSIESPRNNNWYLLTLASRRGLTFLEQQTEVDATRLGVYGHSMGGHLTVYVAGSDSRVKAAAPSVGGSGFRTQPWPLLPQQSREVPNGDVSLFDNTLGFEAYAPRIQSPLLWLGATNDFHGIMDDTYRTADLIAGAEVRYSFAPHLNHRFTPDCAVSRLLWLDQHLRDGQALPRTPQTRLTLATDDGVPWYEVEPDATQSIDHVQIYYSIDPDPQARFWRSVDATVSGNVWSAKLPIMSPQQPLFAFANVSYSIAPRPAAPQAGESQLVTLSSHMSTVTPDQLQQAGVRATDEASEMIEDFSHGWRDWYLLSPNNPHHWEFSTRKLNDPKWQATSDKSLVLELEVQQANELVIKLTENFFRPYRGPSRDYVAVVRLQGGERSTIDLTPQDFVAADGRSLSSWSEIDVLSLRAYEERPEKLLGSKQWQGAQPTFYRIFWR